MSLITQNRYLNLVPGITAPVVVHCSYGDYGQTLAFAMINGDDSYVPDVLTTSITCHGVRADGAGIGPYGCAVVNGNVTLTLEQAMTAVQGPVLMELTFADSSGVTGTANFCLLVEEATFPDGVTYDNDPSVYQAILDYVMQFQAQLNNAISSMTVDSEVVDIRLGADGVTYTTAGEAVRTQVEDVTTEVGTVATDLATAYDSTATYAVGDYCVQDNVLYQCNTEIATAEDFDSTHWTAVTVTDEITPLKSQLKLDYQNTKDYLGQPDDYKTTNLVVENDLIQGKYLDINGDVIDAPNNTYWLSPFIDVGYADYIYENLYETNNILIACYDVNQSHIKNLKKTSDEVEDTASYRAFHLPIGTKYIKVATRTAWKATTVVAKYFWPGSPLAAGTYVTKTPETVAGKVSFLPVPTKLAKYVAFGDSLTAGRVSDDWTYRPELVYPAVFGAVYNYSVINHAIGGQALTNTTYSETAYTTVNSHISDVADADLITLRWGNNDLSSVIGDVETSDTILYEYNRIIELIRSNNAHAQIVVLSPGNITIQGDASTDYWYNSAMGHFSLYDFNDALFNFCESKGIKYVDVNGWMPISQMSNLLGDGVHPALSAFDTCSSYIARCVAESLNTMENDEKIKDIQKIIGKEINLGTFTDNTFINRSTGEVGGDTTTWTSSGFVPVLPNAEIYFMNSHNRVQAGLCQYDSNQQFISALSAEDTKLVNFKVTTAENAAYIRVTGRKSPWVAPTAYYTNYALASGNAKKINTFSTTIDGVGIILANGKTLSGLNGLISHTDYIAVEPQSTVTITKMYPTALSGVFLYDSNKNTIGRIRSLAYESTIATFTIEIPDGVSYIRYNVTNANASSTTVTKIKKISKTEEEKLSTNLFGIAGIYEPFARLNQNHSPMFTLIDDDTASMYQIDTFHDICKIMGIRGTYAVITKNLTNVTGLKAKLLEYEEEGFQMVTHCQDQQTYLRATTDQEKAQTWTNMVTAQREMREAGFINYNYWVSPYGVHSDFHKMLAKNLGFKCLMSVAQLMYEGYTPYEDRWFIPRMELYPTDSEGNQTLQDIKDQIDQCVASNGWLSVATHLYQWSEEPVETGYTRIKEMLQYAKDAGMQFVTLAEGFETWRPVYDLHDMIG